MRHTKILNFFLLSSLALLFVVFLLLVSQNYQCLSCQNNKVLSNISHLCFKNNCFGLELALTSEQQAKGLMFRQELAYDKGMLFIFSKEWIYPFWMKNTLIPLDMIWLNNNKEIVYIKKSAQPCGAGICLPIIPLQKAKYVLEINAGIAEKIPLNLGDQAIFK